MKFPMLIIAAFFMVGVIMGDWILLPPETVLALALLAAGVALAAVWLRADSGAGRLAVLWLFAVIWATDTGAYFTGRTLGGPKLAPRLSPGKTWAGVAGGMAAACLAGLAAATVADFGPVWALVLASAVLSLVGQGGDLAISGMKRHFDAKDSGHIIPGHGGVLDRLDSTVASVLLLAALLFALQAWGLRWP